MNCPCIVIPLPLHIHKVHLKMTDVTFALTLWGFYIFNGAVNAVITVLIRPFDPYEFTGLSQDYTNDEWCRRIQNVKRTHDIGSDTRNAYMFAFGLISDERMISKPRSAPTRPKPPKSPEPPKPQKPDLYTAHGLRRNCTHEEWQNVYYGATSTIDLCRQAALWKILEERMQEKWGQDPLDPPLGQQGGTRWRSNRPRFFPSVFLGSYRGPEDTPGTPPEARPLPPQYLECCTIVGVQPNFSRNDLKTALKEIGKGLHPDKHLESESEKWTKAFREFHDAYEFLKQMLP